MTQVDDLFKAYEEYLAVSAKVQQAQVQRARQGSLWHMEERLRTITETLSQVHIVSNDEHPDEFDDPHNLREHDNRKQWTLVRGCPSCDEIRRRFGLDDLWRERAEMERRILLLKTSQASLDELVKERDVVAARVDKLIRLFRLPDFEHPTAGQAFPIVKMAEVTGFMVQGKPILDSGVFVDYRLRDQLACAVFDHSGQLVAHHAGDGIWKLVGLGRRHIQDQSDSGSVKVRGGFDVSRQNATTDIIISYPNDPDDEHRHIIIDDDGNVIMNEDRPNKSRPTDQ
jgi:hypothetical protein